MLTGQSDAALLASLLTGAQTASESQLKCMQWVLARRPLCLRAIHWDCDFEGAEDAPRGGAWLGKTAKAGFQWQLGSTGTVIALLGRVETNNFGSQGALLHGRCVMFPSTVDRVPQSTAASVNDEIRRQMEERVERCAAAGPEMINRRLLELDEEWDVERTLEANAATLITVGSALALVSNRRYAFVPLVVGGFLLQHAIQGWCPPLPVLRRLGFRTQTEIEEERFALKSLRGDFRGTNGAPSEGRAERVDKVLKAVRS